MKSKWVILVGVIVLTGSFIGCSSSVGINESNSPKTTILTEEELDYFNGDEFLTVNTLFSILS